MRFKKLKIPFAFILVLFVLYGAAKIIPYKNQNLWGYFHDYVIFNPAKTKLKAIEGKPLIEIKIDLIKLSYLLTLHDSLDFNKSEDIKIYNSKNKWVKCEVKIDGESFNAKVKSHSTDPNNHKKDNRISLRLKLKEGRFLGEKEFKLIVFERISERFDQMKILAEAFDVNYLNSELVNVQINNREVVPYFFEKRFKRNFSKTNCFEPKFDKRKSSLQLELVDTGNIDYSKTKVKTSINNKFLNVFKNMNSAIKNGRIDTIKKYLDIDYFARFHAACIVAGYNGHGMNISNLVMPLDTTKMKFFPFLHRDFMPTYLTSNQLFKSNWKDENGNSIPNSNLLITSLLKDEEYLSKLDKEYNNIEIYKDKILSCLDSLELEWNRMFLTSKPSFLGVPGAFLNHNPYKDHRPIIHSKVIHVNLDFLIQKNSKVNLFEVR